MLAIIGSRVLKKDSSRRFTAFFLLFLLVLSCAALVYSAQSFRDRLDDVRASDSDNAGWLVSQLDVDHKALALALDRTLMASVYPEYSREADGLDAARIRFDIFYSRVNILLATLNREEIPSSLADRLLVLDDVRSQLATELDAIADDDMNAVLRFAESVHLAAPLVREITTMSLQFHVAQSDRVREMEQSLLRRFWVQSIVLLVLMLGSAVLALRLWRELEDRTVKMHRALDTVSRVFDVSLSAIVIADMAGRIQLANPAAAKIFGVPADQMVGLPLEQVITPFDLRKVHRQKMELHRQDGHRTMIGAGPLRMDAMRMDGTPFHAEVSVVTDSDLEGKPILIGFIRDISDFVAAEEKLLEARDEAQRHASAKTMFLATMSHEMRTPLHGLMASLDLLDGTALGPEDRALLQTARDCSDRALQQVNDVLEITRLGESTLGEVAFRPKDLAGDILRELTPMAGAKGTKLDLVLKGAGADRLCLGLANAFSRALYNLAGNAVKFTDKGGVAITLTFNPVADSALRLRVEVSDTGIGIAPEDQDRIFAEFETVNALARGRDSGTGLGLPIVRLAVARMGGTLSLRSAPGEGSVFSFELTLPIAPDLPDLQREQAENVTSRVRHLKQETPLDVLVVDDNTVNVTLMSKMVQRIGHRTDQATDGLQAVAMASAKPYDIILMDVSMPVMDGHEATGIIRSGGLSSKAVIIGVTAFSDEERLAELTAAGMDSVLTKPVNTAELAKAMAQQWGNRLSGTQADAEYEADSSGDFAQAFGQLQDMLDRQSALRFLGQALTEADRTTQGLTEADIDMDAAADLIHSTVGSTAVVGFSQLSRLMAQAEDAARTGNKATLKALYLPLKEKLDQELAAMALATHQPANAADSD
ncbi:MAG: ATP-binding protein [Paracoccaceae bacterium]